MKKGDRVTHPIWGEGKFVRTFIYNQEINPQSDDATEMAEVDFFEYGKMDVELTTIEKIIDYRIE